MSLRGEIYWAHAAECEAVATTATADSKERAMFLELAERWRNLARRTETLERDEWDAPPYRSTR
jgi:hypothetical protein